MLLTLGIRKGNDEEERMEGGEDEEERVEGGENEEEKLPYVKLSC